MIEVRTAWVASSSEYSATAPRSGQGGWRFRGSHAGSRRSPPCDPRLFPSTAPRSFSRPNSSRPLRGRKAPKDTRLQLFDSSAVEKPEVHETAAQKTSAEGAAAASGFGDNTRMSPDRSRRPMGRAETSCRLRVVQYREKSIRPQGPSLVLSGPRSQTSTPPMQSAGRSFARLSSRRTSATCSPCNQ